MRGNKKKKKKERKKNYPYINIAKIKYIVITKIMHKI